MEIAIVVYEIRHMIVGHRTARAVGSGVHACFTAAFCVLMKHKSAARIAALEFAMWRYVLFSWRDQPDVPEGFQPFVYHRKSNYAAVVGMMLGIVAIETVAMHLLLMSVNLLLACAFTVLSLYAAVWILGDMRGVMLNPILVGQEHLVIRWEIFRSIPVPAAMDRYRERERRFNRLLRVADLGLDGSPEAMCTVCPAQDSRHPSPR